MAGVYMLFKPPSLFSDVPNVGSFPVSSQNQARQKHVPCADPRKIETLDMWSSAVLSFPGKIWGLGVSFLLHDAVLATGGVRTQIIVRGCLGLSHQLSCAWFHACPGCRSLSVGFWICHNGIWLVYCCSIMVPMGEGGSRTSYFSFLLTSIFSGTQFFSLISVHLYILFLLLGWKLSLPFLSNIQIAFKTMV